MTDMPLGDHNDRARAARLALAVVDNDRARFDAAMTDAAGLESELVYALVRNWLVASMISCSYEKARVWIENMIIDAAEHDYTDAGSGS